MKRLSLAITAFSLFSASAMAADLAPQPVEPVVPVAPSFTWTGFYVGAEAGYGWGDSKITSRFPGGGPLLKSSPDPDGGFGGAYLGYNYQFGGNFVLGIETDFNGGSIKATDGVTINGGPFPVLQGTTELDWFGATRARVGYAFDRFLPYLAAGVAYGNVTTGYNIPVLGGVSGTKDSTQVGWTAGAGLEYAVTDNLIARVEYRYTDYGSVSQTSPALVLPPGTRTKTKLSTNDVRIGISAKF
jgi:outer membrane immunogenic protein